VRLYPTLWAWNLGINQVYLLNVLQSPSHAVGLELSNSYWTYGRTYTSPSHKVGSERRV